MTRWLIGLVVVVVLIASIFVEPLQTLVFGWIGFLVRVLPKSSADGPTVLVSVAAVVLFTGGLHWAGRAWGPQWKWRYSIACSALVFVLFAAGVAMVGIFHMGAWYATSKEPVRVPTLISVSNAFGRVKTGNDMRKIAFGMHNYDSAYD